MIIYCVIQQLHSQIEDNPKSMQYKSFKALLEVERYLKIYLAVLYRKILANFRYYGHAIMIETDRHLNIDRNGFVSYVYREMYMLSKMSFIFLIFPSYTEP